jgi:hypothetical protein
MVRMILTAGLAALLLAVFTAEGLAFRCGSGLVVEGDRTGKVLIECGPPSSKEVVPAKTGGTSRPVSGKKKGQSAGSEYRERSGKVERWTYNCGDHDLIYVLTFEGGVLTHEETQGHGRGRSDCQGRR